MWTSHCCNYYFVSLGRWRPLVARAAITRSYLHQSFLSRHPAKCVVMTECSGCSSWVICMRESGTSLCSLSFWFYLQTILRTKAAICVVICIITNLNLSLNYLFFKSHKPLTNTPEVLSHSHFIHCIYKPHSWFCIYP